MTRAAQKKALQIAIKLEGPAKFAQRATAEELEILLEDENTSNGARLPSFNFLEEFIKFNTNKDKTEQNLPLERVAAPSPAKPEPKSDLDIELLAELVKCIFRKVDASEQAFASEEQMSVVLNHKDISLLDKFILGTYLKRKSERLYT